jgi:hypothetical protein
MKEGRISVNERDRRQLWKFVISIPNALEPESWHEPGEVLIWKGNHSITNIVLTDADLSVLVSHDLKWYGRPKSPNVSIFEIYPHVQYNEVFSLP